MVPPLSPVKAESQGMVARLRHRFGPSAPSGAAPRLPEPPRLGLSKGLNFNASIAELLLVNRLKARIQRRTHAPEIMERASHIVFVTCKNWFSSADGKSPQQRTPL
ncbi:MAG: hypothetical protein JWQ72_1084 [Polaromonas sp.]|nr:hypothetical protein [Polaromonas sp.]